MRIVIAGGGISGLSLAHALQARGAQPLVLEAEARPGGKLGTDEVDGYRCEWGPQSFSFRDPAAQAVLKDLGLEAQLVLPTDAVKRRGVVAGGRLEPVPIDPLAFARSRVLGPVSKLRVLADLALPRGPTGRGGDESVAEFGRRHLGKDAAERLFYPLVSGLYAGDPESISLPAAFPSLARLERDHRSLLLGAARALEQAGLGPRTASFEHGLGQMIAALAARLGDRLRLGCALRRVERDGEGWKLGIEQGGRLLEERTDVLVLASPAHASAPLVAGLDPELPGLLEKIPYVPVTLTYLGYRAQALPRPLDLYGFLVPPSEGSQLLGGVFTSAIFPRHAPEGHALVSARIGGARRRDLASLPDQELVDLIHGEFTRLLGVRERPVFFRAMRHARALPQYTLGHRERLEQIEAAERRLPGLFLTGNAYRGLGIADCLRNAVPMAERVLAYALDGGPARS